jgi:hypothetical protein
MSLEENFPDDPNDRYQREPVIGNESPIRTIIPIPERNGSKKLTEVEEREVIYVLTVHTNLNSLIQKYQIDRSLLRNCFGDEEVIRITNVNIPLEKYLLVLQNNKKTKELILKEIYTAMKKKPKLQDLYAMSVGGDSVAKAITKQFF